MELTSHIYVISSELGFEFTSLAEHKHYTQLNQHYNGPKDFRQGTHTVSGGTRSKIKGVLI